MNHEQYFYGSKSRNYDVTADKVAEAEGLINMQPEINEFNCLVRTFDNPVFDHVMVFQPDFVIDYLHLNLPTIRDLISKGYPHFHSKSPDFPTVKFAEPGVYEGIDIESPKYLI